MCEFYYDCLLPKFGNKLHLCFTDTDSFICHIEIPDLYADMADISGWFDTSNFHENHFLFSATNKRVLGKFKSETGGSGMPVFAGRRYQRGHELGQSIAGLLKRFIVSFVAPHAKQIGKQILSNVAKTGLELVGDVAAAKSAKESLKERALTGIKRTVGDIVRQSPINFERSNNDVAKRPRTQQTVRKKKKKRVTVKPGKRRTDILG